MEHKHLWGIRIIFAWLLLAVKDNRSEHFVWEGYNLIYVIQDDEDRSSDHESVRHVHDFVVPS